MTTHDVLDITVLAGGISHERDVSLRSGRRVADALASAGHTVRVIDPDAHLLDKLADHRPDLIWPALHGKTGEDGALLGLLDAAGHPTVAAGGESAALAWFKPIASTLVRRVGRDVPQSITLTRETFRDLGAARVLDVVRSALDGIVVVKPSEGGSAQGVSIVRDPGQLPRAMVDAYTYSDLVVIERYVEGTEVTVAVIDVGDGPEALPIVEIEPVNGTFTFDARYNAGETRFFTPARLNEETARSTADAAVAIHRLLSLGHLSRIDFIVDRAGEPWFLEANVLPGLTETSLVPQAIAASGRSLADTYSQIARAALG